MIIFSDIYNLFNYIFSLILFEIETFHYNYYENAKFVKDLNLMGPLEFTSIVRFLLELMEIIHRHRFRKSIFFWSCPIDNHSAY